MATFMCEKLIARKWRRQISPELGFRDLAEALKGTKLSDIFQQLLCSKERVVSDLVL